MIHQHYAPQNCLRPPIGIRLLGPGVTKGPLHFYGTPRENYTPATGPNRKMRRREAALARYFNAALAKYMAHHPNTPFDKAVEIVRSRYAR